MIVDAPAGDSARGVNPTGIVDGSHNVHKRPRCPTDLVVAGRGGLDHTQLPVRVGAPTDGVEVSIERACMVGAHADPRVLDTLGRAAELRVAALERTLELVRADPPRRDFDAKARGAPAVNDTRNLQSARMVRTCADLNVPPLARHLGARRAHLVLKVVRVEEIAPANRQALHVRATIVAPLDPARVRAAEGDLRDVNLCVRPLDLTFKEGDRDVGWELWGGWGWVGEYVSLSPQSFPEN